MLRTLLPPFYNYSCPGPVSSGSASGVGGGPGTCISRAPGAAGGPYLEGGITDCSTQLSPGCPLAPQPALHLSCGWGEEGTVGPSGPTALVHLSLTWISLWPTRTPRDQGGIPALTHVAGEDLGPERHRDYKGHPPRKALSDGPGWCGNNFHFSQTSAVPGTHFPSQQGMEAQGLVALKLVRAPRPELQPEE